jgi:hypothetical protein
VSATDTKRRWPRAAWALLALIWPLFAAATARAQDLGSLRLEALANLDVDAANPMWVYAVGAALALIIVWNVASRLRHELAPGTGAAKAHNLYLQLHFVPVRTGVPEGPGDPPPASIGHLLALMLDSAVFVASSRYARGQLLDLELGSLPGYPDGAGRVRAEVINLRLAGDGADSYLIKVRFQPLAPDGREALRRYLQALAHSERYAHA